MESVQHEIGFAKLVSPCYPPCIIAENFTALMSFVGDDLVSAISST